MFKRILLALTCVAAFSVASVATPEKADAGWRYRGRPSVSFYYGPRYSYRPYRSYYRSYYRPRYYYDDYYYGSPRYGYRYYDSPRYYYSRRPGASFSIRF